MAVLESDGVNHSDTIALKVNGTNVLTANSTSLTFATSSIQNQSGNAAFELGNSLSGNRNCFIDFHAADSVDFNTRVERKAGTNGTFDIIQTGTGSTRFINSSGAFVTAQASEFQSFGNTFTVSDSQTGFIADSTARVRKGHLLFSTNSADLRWRHSDRNYTWSWQADRNVVLYDSGTPVFATNSGVSDLRLKDNIQPTQINGTNTIKQLNVVDFTWKEDSCMCDNQKVHTGFIAQEVKEIIPDSIKILGENNTHLLHKEELIPHLIKCVQELISKIETLEAKVLELEAS